MKIILGLIAKLHDELSRLLQVLPFFTTGNAVTLTARDALTVTARDAFTVTARDAFTVTAKEMHLV